MQLVDFLGTWYSKGPSQISISHHGLQIFVSPSKVNSSVVYQNHMLAQLFKGKIITCLQLGKILLLELITYIYPRLATEIWEMFSSFCFYNFVWSSVTYYRYTYM